MCGDVDVDTVILQMPVRVLAPTKLELRKNLPEASQSCSQVYLFERHKETFPVAGLLLHPQMVWTEPHQS